MTDHIAPRYYLHRATMTVGFFWPVFPLFLLHRDVSFTGIGTLLAVEAAVMLVSEMPTGYLGDRLGRRNSLVAGSAFVLLAELGFVVAHSFGAFVVVYVSFGLGRTFRSGSGDAWLYDVLARTGRETEFTRIRGRGESVTHWASTGAMVASGLLYAFDPVAPFLVAAALTAVDLVVLVGLLPAVETTETTVDAREVLPVVRAALTQSSVWSFVVVAAAFFGVERAVSEFIPSVTKTVLGTAVTATGSVDVVFVGLFFAGFTATSAVASYFAGDVRARFGAPAVLVGAGVLSAGLMVGSALVPALALASFFAVKTADALVLPLVNGYVNDHVDTGGRATTLSATSMLFTVAKMPLLVAAGALADWADAILAVAALGAFFCLAAAVVSVASSRTTVRNATESPAE